MDKYVAVLPVTFDRSYAIGEEIPDSVIDPNHVKRLINGGRIARVNNAQTDAEDECKASETLCLLVEQLEELLEITHEGESPDIYARAEICMSMVREVCEGVMLESDSDSDDDGVTPTDDDENSDDENDSSDSETPSEDDDEIAPTDDANDVSGFKCTVCEKTFKTQAGLTSHMKTHAEKE